MPPADVPLPPEPGVAVPVGEDQLTVAWALPADTSPLALDILVLQKTSAGIEAQKQLLPLATATGRLVVAATLATCLAWLSFSTVEMTGFRAAFEASPAKARVLGLDFVGTSEFVGGRPFMQMMAHVQAEQGGTLNFSFAQHGSSLVSYRSPRVHTWNPSLDWRPEMVSIADVLAFDVVLVNGLPASHQAFQAFAPWYR